MQRTCSPLRRAGCAALTFAAVLVTFQTATAEPSSLPPEMLEDAELTDVFFLDPDRGWAVGDRGAILWSDDGGRNWQLADSPVNCRLEAVWFVDEQHGWAVGGWPHPYSHRTAGVVLRSEDGGRRWQRMPAQTIPQLWEVRFFDRRRGWAVGAPSAMHPAGIFRTEDSGRTWSSLPITGVAGWLAGDCLGPQRAVVVGREAAAARVSGITVEPLDPTPDRLRHLHAARIDAQAGIWLAGDGGLFLHSPNGGRDWSAPRLPLPQDVAAQIDFRAVAVRGSTCWLAGDPGSCLLRSQDGGDSWQVLHTEHRLPINALMFLDQQHGWAVGPLGTILATRDGGETWLQQRSGGSRAAVLGLYSNAAAVPVEALTRLCGDEGYLGAVELLTRADMETRQPADATRSARHAAGIAAAGAATTHQTWRFPLRQPGLKMSGRAIVAGWDAAHGGRGAEILEKYLVLRLRQWRPEIVLTHGSSPDAPDPLPHVINQVVLAAVERAADPEAYPEQIRTLRLPPWRANKLFATHDNVESADVVIETSRLATQLGRSIRDHSVASHGWLQDDWSPPAERVGFELLLSTVPRPLAAKDFFSGLSVPPTGDARRRLGHPSATNMADLRRATQQRRTIETLLTRADSDSQDTAGWLAQIDDLTRALPPLAAGEILYQLAQHYRRLGKYALAAEALHALLDRYPTHPLGEPAAVWLIGYASSSEVAVAFPQQPADRSASPPVSLANAILTELPDRPAGQPPAAATTPATNQLASFQTTAAPLLGSAKLPGFVEQLKQRRSALTAEPALRLALASVHRRLEEPLPAKRLWQQVANSQPVGAWRQTARTELWFAAPRGRPPKPALVCRAAAEKPFLDGQLDEAAWDEAAVAALHSQLDDDEDWPAQVLLARDDEFLYVGLKCRKVPGWNYAASDQTRRRDQDLSQQDRVELLIDVDRDYQSFFRLTVDHRGWTGESCWGDARWNPTWYVAASSDENSWFIEAAIPLAELGTADSSNRDAWAIGLQRIVPGIGFQSWTTPASVSGQPEGFGYLRLESR